MEMVKVTIKEGSLMAAKLGGEIEVPTFEDGEVGIVTEYMAIGALNDALRRRWTTVANPSDHGVRGGGRRKSQSAEQEKADTFLKRLMAVPEDVRNQIAELMGIKL